MTDPTPKQPLHVSDRPLWLIAVLLVVHVAWMAFCALWIPSTFGTAITKRFGSPLFILPPVIFVYTLAPLIASFSELGREYWELVGKGGTAKQATIKLLIFGMLLVLLGVGMHLYAHYS